MAKKVGLIFILSCLSSCGLKAPPLPVPNETPNENLEIPLPLPVEETPTLKKDKK